jgi:MFS family permease
MTEQERRVLPDHIRVAIQSGPGHDIRIALIAAFGAIVGSGVAFAISLFVLRLVSGINPRPAFDYDQIVGVLGWRIGFILAGVLCLGFGAATLLFWRTRDRERNILRAQYDDLRVRADALAERFNEYERRKAGTHMPRVSD